MKTEVSCRAGAATDTGQRRATNEDRVLVDETRGVFLFVDGLGGHAAGEIAAETAVSVIAERIPALGLDLEGALRSAIAEANNRIYGLSLENDAWRGMACVLTIAVVQDDRVTVGHVGDSRLYLIWNGHLRKLTCDHSPV